MIIIVEGCDFSGKSTLALQLANDLNAFMIRSRKPKSVADVMSWASLVQSTFDIPVVCDRSPLFSDLIYGPIIRGESAITPRQARAILGLLTHVVVVYCNPGKETVLSANNDQMDGVKENLEKIYDTYQEHMAQCPVYLHEYNWKEEGAYDSLLSSLETEIFLGWDGVSMPTPDYEMELIENFHDKYGVPMPECPQLLAPDVFEFRVKFMQEELNEFIKDHIEENKVKAFDALLDLTYVLKGTALLMGISPGQWSAGMDAVQKANMSKVRVTSAADSKRGHSLDVKKPLGWVGPEAALKQILDGYL